MPPRTIPDGYVEIAPGEYAKAKLKVKTVPVGVAEVVVFDKSDIADTTGADHSVSMRVSMSPTTDESKLNKWEKEYLLWIKRELKPEWHGVQCLSLKIGDDCRYVPDFITIESGEIYCREVKGFFRPQAKVKMKAVARIYPWIRFVLARKSKGAWSHELVKP